MDVRRIELPVAVTLRLQSRSGNVAVIAEPREDIEAATDSLESFFDEDGALVVRSSRGGRGLLSVRCPAGTDVAIGTQSGSVKLDGDYGDVHVTTMSGSIEVDAADDADLRTMSGGVTVGSCRGRCRVNAVSGRVVVGSAASASLSSVSGSIKIGNVTGAMRGRTVSGSIELRASGEGPIAVKTISGRVHIELPEGCEPQTSFRTRGRVRCEFPSGADCRIEAASLSGAIEVVPA